ncbi:MAG: hypothetical protein HQM08_09230 [Candidatus Riflebacteria bacterium]|nr:hypothetical protein [Candidatus Riflebacteria bacterium]
MKREFFGLVLTALLFTAPIFAGVEASGSLDLGPTISKISEALFRNLEPSTCLGTQVNVGDMTIIPVGSKGFGFGLGGGLNQEGETDNRDKDAREKNKDHTGIGCGAGGFVKIVAFLLIKKDGTVQIQRMEENFLAQIAHQYAPILHEMLSKFYEFRMLKFQKGSEGQPPTPPLPPKN